MQMLSTFSLKNKQLSKSELKLTTSPNPPMALIDYGKFSYKSKLSNGQRNSFDIWDAGSQKKSQFINVRGKSLRQTVNPSMMSLSEFSA